VGYIDTPGLLLINLGTPSSPRPSDVRPYLREFLSDPRVIDIAAWKRWLILNLFILPFRPRRSGEAYAKIWTDRGSPLLFHSRDLVAKVQERLGDDVVVDLAMRYNEPSIADALESLRRRGIRRIVAFPLYPQYSTAATGSSMEKVYAEAAKYWVTPYIQVVPPFYDHPAFIEACAEQARPVIESTRPEKVFFSFHGVPERHVTKGDLTGSHCLCRDDCCDTIAAVNADCYRAQCFATARSLAERLGVPEDHRTVCFQSRLGRDPWLKPYTDHVVRDEAQRGVKRAVILSPAFVADCLETVEELGMRAVEDWKANGGETLRLVPAVNASDAWSDAVVRIAREASPWLGAGSQRHLPVDS
jgi:ferrochelatase